MRVRQASRAPSRENSHPPTPAGNAVSRRGSPPARSRRYSWLLCDAESPGTGRTDAKAIALPSGRQRGADEETAPAVSWRAGAPPSTGTSQIALIRRFWARSTRVTV